MSRYHRGGGTFAKPENALKRADELIAVGQKPAALQALHDVITSKRYRSWQKPLEAIMFRYVDLCVDMKKGRYAKDGLIHYRNICQNVNVTSLEDVIKYFIQQAHAKAEQAQAQADDRTDRELVTPWFKFLWESYRNVLDILRNNSRLEALYALATTKAFAFCLQYKRTTEFKRLCDILRNHLASLGKYREQRDRPDLSLPESLQFYLDTRFEQLRVACELELWQEAFRSVEDIQGLLAFSKKPHRREMATYFARLTQIFTKSGSALYNSYAWFKLFSHERVYNKKLSPADLQTLASCAALAALAVPPYARARVGPKQDAESEVETERALRMASILGLPVDANTDASKFLSRTNLMAEVQAKAILSQAHEDVRAVFALLETEFNPLELCQRLAPLLERVAEIDMTLAPGANIPAEVDVGFFAHGIQKVAALKALQQLGGVYSVMRIDSLASLVPFMSFGELEQLVAEAVKHGFLQAKLDHKNGTVAFGQGSVEGNRIAGHLALLAQRLARAVQMTAPSGAVANNRKLELVRHAREVADKENLRSLARKVKIEQRKEEAERAMQERERDEEMKKLMAERLTAEAEEKRREEERRKREMERIERMMAERDEEERRAQEELAKKAGSRIELEKKIAKMLRHMDHVERAKREEEVPLLQAAMLDKAKIDEQHHIQEQARFSEVHRKAWETDVVEKRRLMRMWEDKEVFAGQIMQRRTAEFAQLKAAHEAKVEEMRAMRRHERALRRRQEFVRRCRQQVEACRREEEEAARKVEEERRAKELAERQRELDRIAEVQRKREEELEARKQEERERLLAGASRPAPAPVSGDGYIPPSRRPVAASASAEAPSGADRNDRWGPPRPAAGGDGPPGGAYRPPRGDGAAPPPASGGAFRPSRGEGAAPPPASGGAYRPPVRRDGAAPPPASGGAYRAPRGDDRRPDDRRPTGGSRW